MMQIGHAAALRIRVIAARMQRVQPDRVIDQFVAIAVVDLVRPV